MQLRTALCTSILLATASIGSALAAEDTPLAAKPVPIDRDQVFVGKQRFQVINNGQQAGMMTVHSRFNDKGQYLIHDHSESEALGVLEEIFVVMDGDSFAPLRSQVHARMGDHYIDANWQWQWQDNLADSQIEIYNFASGEHRHRALSESIPAGTLTRAGALYLANAMDLGENKVIELNWLNTLNGQISPITYTVTGSAEISVPAGSFDTWTVLQEGGQPGNTIYVSKDSPRRIVRFDVTGMDMRLELMEK